MASGSWGDDGIDAERYRRVRAALRAAPTPVSGGMVSAATLLAMLGVAAAFATAIR